jgi:hypothetical protein
VTSMDVGRLGNIRRWLQAGQWQPIRGLTVAPGGTQLRKPLLPLPIGNWPLL